MSNARNLANLLGTNTTIQTAKLADSAISTAKLADNAVTSTKLGAGYIQSKHHGQNATNDVTGENNLLDVTWAGGGSVLSVDMGTPNSTDSVFILDGDCQAHLDGSTQTAVSDTAGYMGLGLARKIGTGSWTVIYRQGKWAHGNNADIDYNFRNFIHYRDRPNTSSQVQYKLFFMTHRAGCNFSRTPTDLFGKNTNLYCMEFDGGDSS